MSKEEIVIRKATVEDAGELLRIYAPYVEKTAITFEYDVPSVEEFENRIRGILATHTYIVAQRDEEILGYAYLTAFFPRAAYSHTATTTIYVKESYHGKGLGRMLYEALEKEATRLEITNLYACIGYPSVEDEYLTKNSAEFHEHMGFSKVGEFHSCGYKFGRWYSIIWMEKIQ